MLSRNKREELYERFRGIQRSWQMRWMRHLSASRVEMNDSPDTPERGAIGHWQPAFKILIQPLCEKDIGAATYAYLFVDIGGPGEGELSPPWTTDGKRRLRGKSLEPVDDENSLKQEILTRLAVMRTMIEEEILPPATDVRRRCEDCEFRNYCGDVF